MYDEKSTNVRSTLDGNNTRMKNVNVIDILSQVVIDNISFYHLKAEVQEPLENSQWIHHIWYIFLAIINLDCENKTITMAVYYLPKDKASAMFGQPETSCGFLRGHFFQSKPVYLRILPSHCFITCDTFSSAKYFSTSYTAHSSWSVGNNVIQYIVRISQ